MTTHSPTRAVLTGAVIVSIFLTWRMSTAVAEEPPKAESTAVAALEALEKRTGRSAEELLPAIELYASMVEMLAEDLESGAVTKEELTDVKVITKNLLAAVDQDSSMDAATKLVALRSLNGGEIDDLKKWLRDGIANYYASILEKENQMATSYRKAVEKEAAKDSELATALAAAKAENNNAQQGGAGQPATRSESDSGGGDKSQLDSDGRSR